MEIKTEVKIKSIEFDGYEDVFNMEVADHHNYSVNGGFILHNCDSIRYFVVSRPSPTAIPEPKKIYNFDFEKPKAPPTGFGEKITVI